MMQHSNTTREINNKQEMHDLTSDEECILLDSAGLMTQTQVVGWQDTQEGLLRKQVDGDHTHHLITQIIVPLYLFTNYQTFTEIVTSPSPGVSRYANSIEIFLAYVDEDEELRTILEKWLDVLKRQLRQKQQQNLITSWSNASIVAGKDWKKEIEKHLGTMQK